MKLHTVAVITLAALVATAGGAVAAPGNTPIDPGADDSAHGNSDDARNGEPAEIEAATEENDVNRYENASATEDRAVEMSENASVAEDHAVERGENESAVDGDASAANAQGPGEGLPDQVPDHVTQIHDLIRQFVDGTFDGSLGEAISGVTASDDAASENPTVASG